MSDAESLWQLWVDGTALPNPGRIGLGTVLISPAGERQTRSLALGRSGCNNEAELHALRVGLEQAREAGATRLAAISDSDFVVRHVLGQQTTRVARLVPLIEALQVQLQGFEQLELRWVPRHRNQDADHLARAALGLGGQ
jgi:ribonuclease HI